MSQGKVKVWVDSQGCISCGACVAICPSIFAFGEDGKSHAVKQPENEDEVKCAKEAEEACPVSVITVEEIGDEKDRNKNNVGDDDVNYVGEDKEDGVSDSNSD